jgi:uncharacterized integral membrane protein (TIGR00698 family)
MEGVPDLPPVPAAPKKAAAPIWAPGHKALEWVGQRVPGFALAAILAMFANSLADWFGTSVLGYAHSPLSGVPLAILFGMILCNGIGVPTVFQSGLGLCMRQLQRLAIMLLGFRLSLGMVGAIGLDGLPIIVGCIVAALVVIPWLGMKVGLSKRLATLIAVGTSICGVSAIMAVAPTIDAEEEEVSYAVACVVIFGMIAMLAYPYVVPLLFGSDYASAGIFFGTAIHDTAQVTGSALSFQQLHKAPEVLNTATVVKIIRNLSMVIVIPLMAALFNRERVTSAKKKSFGQQIKQLVPLFIVGFLAMTLVRTIGDMSAKPFGVLAPATWQSFLHTMDWASAWFLTVVMAAVGLSTGFAQLKRLGLRPFFVGLSAALLVGGVSFGLIRLRVALGF